MELEREKRSISAVLSAVKLGISAVHLISESLSDEVSCGESKYYVSIFLYLIRIIHVSILD